MTVKAVKTMYVFVDESGCLRANQAFLAGAWFTWMPVFWLNVARRLRHDSRFWRELHFHKVSRQQNDRQYEMIQALLALLAKYRKTWYARLLYVSEADQLAGWRDCSCVDIYDNLMSRLFGRFGGHFPERRCVIVLDEKNRPHWDNYIPVGLQAFLNRSVGVKTDTEFEIVTASSETNDLLQISDIVTSAMRQLVVPS
ncbi:DUF3800 domain-containing protein [Candidatus Desulforudis audaxviator]|uniref:DUF3800 domain-containing protein n=1 Tax=Candidatus Desulforudis audaxviator TaxID=471827 RepID=UPI0005A08450|nr:DUF3800 domain-containing protein [Candidatus Desulforudis audaxviator]